MDAVNKINQKGKVVLTAGKTLTCTNCGDEQKERPGQFVTEYVVWIRNNLTAEAPHFIGIFFHLNQVHSLISNLITKKIDVSRLRVFMF